jgi:hypothetical protein
VLPVIGSPLDSFKQLGAAAAPARQNEILDMKDMKDLQAALPLGLGALGVPIPVVYLKQLRAADSPTQACYQQIITGPLVMTALRDFSLVSGAWQLELSESDSLPLIRDLGLGIAANGKVVLNTELAYWCDIDFTVGLASPIN